MSLSQALNQFAQNLGRYLAGTPSCSWLNWSQLYRSFTG